MATTSPPRSAVRTGGLVLGAVYLVLVAALLLDPSGTGSSNGTNELIDLARRLDMPDSVISHVEFGANILIFIPLPLIGTLIIGWRSVPTWTGWMFMASLAVEAMQFLFFSGARVASTADVVANTSGAMIGAGLVWAYHAARGLDQTT